MEPSSRLVLDRAQIFLDHQSRPDFRIWHTPLTQKNYVLSLKALLYQA